MANPFAVRIAADYATLHGSLLKPLPHRRRQPTQLNPLMKILPRTERLRVVPVGLLSEYLTSVPDVCKTLEISEQYCCWRQKYGGMQPEMAKELTVRYKGQVNR